MSDKSNYRDECRLFLRLKESGQKLTQAEFCHRRTKELGQKLSLGYFKNILKKVRSENDPKKQNVKEKEHKPGNMPISTARRNYADLKTEFMVGKWRTLAEFARAKGIQPKASWFRKQTRGWTKEKKQLDLKSTEIAAQTLAEEHAGRKVRDVLEHVRELEWQMMDVAKLITDGIENWGPVNSAHGAYTGALFIKELHAALKSMTPFLQGLERLSDVNRVFDAYSTGKTDIQTAVIELMKLGVEVPRSMQIMLSQGVDDDPIDDDDPITMEKILARRQQIIETIETQRVEFVETRTKEIRELKQQMGKGSFEKQKELDESEN